MINLFYLKFLQLDPAQVYEVEIPDWDVDKLLNPDYNLQDLYETTLSSRSDIKQFDYQSESARYAMKSASAGYYPSINLFVSYGSQYFSVQGDPEAVFFW